jgi:proteasome accessory factor B
VPEGHQAKAMISTVAVEHPSQPASLRIREGTGHSLRRQATSVTSTGDAWSQATVDFTDTEAFAEEIAGFGPDVVVTGPAELRESVIRRLTGALDSFDTEPDTDTEAGTEADTGAGTEAQR